MTEHHGRPVAMNSLKLRSFVEHRDGGVCAVCGLNAILLRRAFDAELYRSRCDRQELFRIRERLELLGFNPWSFVLWEVDHIIPVMDGGGLLGPKNVRTLCRPCHKAATKQLHERLAREGRSKRIKPPGATERLIRLEGAIAQLDDETRIKIARLALDVDPTPHWKRVRIPKTVSQRPRPTR